ncbi:MAG: pilin [Candidatus Roizmanbacteria bacterium]|nr:pilin [Candidatus Roizmanbacteria bacterium]
MKAWCFLMTILYLFIFLSIASRVDAATCESICKYDTNASLFEEQCTGTFGNVTLTGKPNGKNADLTISTETLSGIGEEKLCVVMDIKGNNGVLSVQEPYIQCKVVEINNSTYTGAVSFPVTSSVNHTFSVFSNAALTNGSSCSDTLTVSFQSSNLPTPTQTPVPNQLCIDQIGEDCVPSGSIICDDSIDQSRGVGFDCKPLCKGYYCKVSGLSGGVVDAEYVKPKSASDLAKQLSGNCGQNGLACCDIELNSFIDNESPDFLGESGNDKYSGIFGWFGDIKSAIFGDTINTITSVAENKTPCNDSLKLDLLLKEDGSIIPAENKYVKSQEESEGSSKSEGYYVVDKALRYVCDDLSRLSSEYDQCLEDNNLDKDEIPYSQVKTCTCRDPDAPSNSPLEGSAKQVFNFLDEMIWGQIVSRVSEKNKADCLQCLTDGKNCQEFPAGFTKSGYHCADNDQASDNLFDYIEYLDAVRISTGKSQDQVLASNLSNTSGDVLGIWDNIRTVVCSFSGNDVASRQCRQCILSAGFWNRGGCTAAALSVRHISNLCRNIESGSSERTKCEECSTSGGVWTGIGCMVLNVQEVIQKQIFGIGLGFSGVASLFCIIFASFRMQTSAGDPEKVKQAQELITSCITGLIIVIFAVVILQVIGVDILRIPGLE